MNYLLCIRSQTQEVLLMSYLEGRQMSSLL